MLRRAAIVAVVLAPTLPLVAWAQATPDRAAALQQQVQDWLRTNLGIAAAPGSTPVRVTAAGDHFDIAAPLGKAPDAPVMTGKLTDAGDGRWALDDLSVPSPSVFRYRLPPSKTPGALEGDVVSTVTIGSQTQHATYDTTFATPSTSSTTLKDMSITTEAKNVTQLTHVDGGEGTATMTPVSDGRVDVAFNSSLDGYTLKMSSPATASPLAVAVGKVSVVGNFAGVSRAGVVDIAQKLSAQLSARSPAPVPPGSVPPGSVPPATVPATPKPAPDPEKMAAMLVSLADLARGVTLDEKFDDLTVTTSNVTGTLKRLSIGLASTAAGGKLQARMPMAAEGLTLPEIGLGSMAKLIPTKLAFTPAVGAVPTDALLRVARGYANKQEPTGDDIASLFSQGPITAGLQDMSLDVAGASFSGSFNTLVTSPNQFSGTGTITAVDIDKLQQAMAADPQTAQFAPVIIFLKGIGRSEQSRMVWDVIYNDGRLLVNGQDMQALMGPPAQSAPPPSAQRPRPARPAPNRP